MTERTQGLTPEEFVDRMEAGNVIEEWPLADMLSETVFGRMFYPAAVGLDAPDHLPALALGRIDFRYGQPLLNVRRTGHEARAYRLRLETESEERDALEQLVGVDVAIGVQLGTEKNAKERYRTARMTRLWGVEQPLLVTNDKGLYPETNVERSDGFIQGIVQDTREVAAKNIANVQLSRPYPDAASLVYVYTNLWSPQGRVYNGDVQEGDQFRSRVTRTHLKKDRFEPSEALIYVFNRDVTKPAR